jgi:hypothetical protein
VGGRIVRISPTRARIVNTSVMIEMGSRFRQWPLFC